jgi:DNA-directed RNA polymerase specialized sigma24 family protein
MADSTAFVATQIPRLRRFARALTGSQIVADVYALAALEAANAAPPFHDQAEARRWLYQTLLASWVHKSTLSTEPEVVSSASRSPIDLKLMAVAPLPRAAFLLESMEEFRSDQVADILQRPLRDVEHLIGQAGETLASQIIEDCLDIENEPFLMQ